MRRDDESHGTLDPKGSYQRTCGAENGKDFAAELHSLARIAMNDGGIAAFEPVVAKRQSDGLFFYQWGRRLRRSSSALGLRQRHHHPDSGQHRCGMFRNHCKEIGPLWLNWHSADSYRRYTQCIAD